MKLTTLKQFKELLKFYDKNQNEIEISDLELSEIILKIYLNKENLTNLYLNNTDNKLNKEVFKDIYYILKIEENLEDQYDNLNYLTPDNYLFYFNYDQDYEDKRNFNNFRNKHNISIYDRTRINSFFLEFMKLIQDYLIHDAQIIINYHELQK